jgi:hypothetical protein
MTALDEAVKSYRTAREAWAHICELTDAIYVDDMTYGPRWFERGNWASRLGAIDKDITAVEQKGIESSGPPTVPKVPPEKISALIGEVLGRPSRPAPGLSHVPLASFHRGQAVVLDLKLTHEPGRRSWVKLHYRRTNQSETWRTAAVTLEADKGRASIPSDYADSPYPLAYYFEIRDASQRSALYPGLGADLADQPYFIARPSGVLSRA